MRLFLVLFLMLTVSWAEAQQLVIPKELDARQAKAFKRITESVSAPCCSNAIPVAYHESGMAVYVRDLVEERLMAGESEDAILDHLAGLELGPSKSPLIFAVPDKNPLGILTWWFPAIIIVLGVALIIYFYRGSKTKRARPTNDVLIETYKQYIERKVEARQP